MNKRTLTLLILLLLASMACRAPFPGGSTDSNVLFQDDFSSTSSGWDQVSGPGSVTDYNNGVYRLYVNEANTDIWANPGLSFTDVRIEVDAAKIGGPDDNDFGVICRAEDVNHFYFFIISSDGYYGIGKISGEDQELIGMERMETSDLIRQGAAANTIRADCVGETLTLYVNGEQLIQVTDSQFTSGDVGLIAGSFSEPGTDIHFDNFKVLKP
jgi:hypothetical protein